MTAKVLPVIRIECAVHGALIAAGAALAHSFATLDWQRGAPKAG